MREIKFRGKAMGGHWFYGLLTKKKIRNSGKVMFAILTDENAIGATVPVLEDSIGQFTGLYDCNGKEIYEGDILQTLEGDSTTTVTFDNGCFTCDRDVFLEEAQVIGNIHDGVKKKND